MIPALQQYPRFEKGSPSTEYQQIINFCVNYLEGMLVGLIHMDIPAELESKAKDLIPLQQKLLSRERTIRHSFQFQIEKHFSDFKSISRTRLKLSHAKVDVTDYTASRIQVIIEKIGEKHLNKHKNQLQNTARRLKTLVHRSDDNYDDNPISPLNLSWAFLASIETLNLSALKNRLLFQLFDHTLNEQLGIFYNQIDLGLYYLDILAELTDPSLFSPPETESVAEDSSKVESFTNQTEPDQAETVKPEENIEDIKAVKEAETKEIIDTVKPEEEIKAVEEVEKDEVKRPEKDKKIVTSISSHNDKAQNNQLEIENHIHDFKVSTENGTLDFITLFSQLNDNLGPLVDKKQRRDIQKFTHFFTGLLNNALLSTPLKTQLSRLSSPLLKMVLIDPFFFRSSSHPVNDFLHSIIDFELRFNHHGKILSTLSQSIDALLQISNPTLNDYQPLIEGYEQYKELEIVRQEKIKQENILREEELKGGILQLINEITEELVVEHDTMQFFYDDWQFLLLHLAHKSGKESADFKNSVNIAKMLGWFLDENKTGSHPRFESTSFKSLLTSIEIGLVTLNFSSEHRSRARKQLIGEYKKANKKSDFAVTSSSAGQGLQLNRSALKFTNTNRKGDQLSSDDPVQFAQNLAVGNWVEIKLESNNKFTRAKLKWKATDHSQFLFIDQRGHKIKECDLEEIKQDFSSGNIKILKKPARLGSSYY